MLQPFHGWSIAALDCAVSVLIGRFVSQFLINGRPRVAGARALTTGLLPLLEPLARPLGSHRTDHVRRQQGRRAAQGAEDPSSEVSSRPDAVLVEGILEGLLSDDLLGRIDIGMDTSQPDRNVVDHAVVGQLPVDEAGCSEPLRPHAVARMAVRSLARWRRNLSATITCPSKNASLTRSEALPAAPRDSTDIIRCNRRTSLARQATPFSGRTRTVRRVELTRVRSSPATPCSGTARALRSPACLGTASTRHRGDARTTRSRQPGCRDREFPSGDRIHRRIRATHGHQRRPSYYPRRPAMAIQRPLPHPERVLPPARADGRPSRFDFPSEVQPSSRVLIEDRRFHDLGDAALGLGQHAPIDFPGRAGSGAAEPALPGVLRHAWSERRRAGLTAPHPIASTPTRRTAGRSERR